MATKKAGGSSKNNSSQNPQYRGVKKFGGELVQAGNILVRQTGSNFFPGEFVGQGKDYTLFAKKTGILCFQKGWKQRTFLTILDAQKTETKTLKTKAQPKIKEAKPKTTKASAPKVKKAKV